MGRFTFIVLFVLQKESDFIALPSMDDDDDQILRDKVESSRKRKYLKSASFGVPKRTREHWNKKEKVSAWHHSKFYSLLSLFLEEIDVPN